MFIGDGTKPREGGDSWKARVDRLEESVKAYRGWDELETVRFLALSLAGEAGELANEIKKEWRSNGSRNWTQEEWNAYRIRVAFEIADVRMLTYRLAVNMGIDEDTSCDAKIDELDNRSDLVVK